MFVTASDFDLHPYMIPGLSKVPSFQTWVDQEEERYLKEVLGYNLYNAFVDGLTQEYSSTVETVIGQLYAYGNNVWEALTVQTGTAPVEGVDWTLEEADNRWLLLKNGNRYLMYGKYYDWVGMKEALKPLIYSLWVDNGAIEFTSNGMVIPNSENSSRVNSMQKSCNAWNQWVRYVGDWCEVNDTLYGYLYFTNLEEQSFDDTFDETFGSFNEYLSYEFTPQERKNAFWNMITVLVDEIGDVVESMRDLSSSDGAKYGITMGLTSPYYFYGDAIDINKQLIQLDKDASTKDKDYPAILLRLPTNEEMVGGMIHYNLNIAIITDTKGDWTSDERYTQKIKPILYPLYELFLDRLADFGFMWDKGKVPPHTKRDMPYYGVEETQGNKAHKFKTKLDAIEIINLRINKKFKNC